MTYKTVCHFTMLQLVVVFTLFTFFITLTAQWCNLNLKGDSVTQQEFLVENYKENATRRFRKTISNRFITHLSAKEKNNIRSELEVRKEGLADFCLSLNTSTNLKSHLVATFSNMIIDTNHGISWCPIYKAASSTWMKYFAVLGGTLSDSIKDLIEKNIVQVNTVVRQAFPYDLDSNRTHEKLRHTKKFLIVRHPLERLVSAYRDKLEHMEGREYYYKRFGRHIVYRYRRNKNATEVKIEPTFHEFLQFIAKEKYFDEHWATFYDTCQPCMIQYDYILKFETFEKDQQLFIEETGLKEYLYDDGEFKNANPNGATSREVVKKYLQDIPQSLLDEVYKIYEKDYKMFSYSPI